MKGSMCKVCGHEHWLREPHIGLKAAPTKEKKMPERTKVDTVYKALRRKGLTAGPAAKNAQKQTGQALATGKPPKGKQTKKHT